MNLLLLCNKFPYPPDDGSSLAIYNMLAGWVDIPEVSVTVFALNTKKHFKNPENFPQKVGEKIDFYIADVDTDITVFRTISNLFTSKAFHASRFITAKTTASVKAILSAKQFDIIQLESVFMGVYLPTIRRYSKAKVVIRMHNIEHLLWQRQTKKEAHFVKRMYLKLQTNRLENFEKTCLKAVDGLIPITNVDADYVKQQRLSDVPTHVVPFGVTPKNYPIHSLASPHSLTFLGAMDWMPNQVGLNWFLKKVWPIVQEKAPQLHLHLAGKHTSKSVLPASIKNVTFHGEVPDAKIFMCSGNIFIVPILSGGGMRIKMLEALAVGCCVVSTTVGAEGILGKHNHHYLLGDSPNAFAAHILSLAQSTERQHELSKNARELVEQQYDNKILISKLFEFYKNL